MFVEFFDYYKREVSYEVIIYGNYGKRVRLYILFFLFSLIGCMNLLSISLSLLYIALSFLIALLFLVFYWTVRRRRKRFTELFEGAPNLSWHEGILRLRMMQVEAIRSYILNNFGSLSKIGTILDALEHEKTRLKRYFIKFNFAFFAAYGALSVSLVVNFFNKVILLKADLWALLSVLVAVFIALNAVHMLVSIYIRDLFEPADLKELDIFKSLLYDVMLSEKKV